MAKAATRGEEVHAVFVVVASLPSSSAMSAKKRANNLAESLLLLLLLACFLTPRLPARPSDEVHSTESFARPAQSARARGGVEIEAGRKIKDLPREWDGEERKRVTFQALDFCSRSPSFSERRE